PLCAEQFLNETFLVDVLRVGVRVREAASKAATEAVARAVVRLMNDDDNDAAAARKVRVAELNVTARGAVAESR
ncbi:Os03g0724000, partial [Oryza sativa Japonica Group]